MTAPPIVNSMTVFDHVPVPPSPLVTIPNQVRVLLVGHVHQVVLAHAARLAVGSARPKLLS